MNCVLISVFFFVEKVTHMLPVQTERHLQRQFASHHAWSHRLSECHILTSCMNLSVSKKRKHACSMKCFDLDFQEKRVNGGSKLPSDSVCKHACIPYSGSRYDCIANISPLSYSLGKCTKNTSIVEIIIQLLLSMTQQNDIFEPFRCMLIDFDLRLSFQ